MGACACFGGCLSQAGTCGTGSSLDSYDATNTSGSVAYNPNTNAGAAGGVVNAASNPLPAPDAGGGNGNFLSGLQQVMTQGLNDAVVSATEFGLGALNDRLAVAAGGQVQPAAAQSPAPGSLTVTGGALKWLLLAGLAYVAYRALK